MPAARDRSQPDAPNICVFGVGSFAHSTLQILKENGARTFCYLTRDYAHYAPSLAAKIIRPQTSSRLVQELVSKKIGLVIPMSIDWAQKESASDLIASGIPIFGPHGESLRLERERDFARQLCAERNIPFPQSFVANSEAEARRIVQNTGRAYVLKNPLCGPFSPIHTIVCETPGETLCWLPRLNYGEGVFLQEYMGRAEIGHIAFVSGGEIYPIATNQEYKRAYTGNLGIVAGAPLGGLVQRDTQDQYGLARQLLLPLRDWFREVQFHGPVQVTAAKRNKRWHVLEYNVRIGVTSGAMILRMLKHPAQVLLSVARNEPPRLDFHKTREFGCSMTLAGYGYPYTQLNGPRVPIQISGQFDCDVWWNEVEREKDGTLMACGHRLADVVALAPTLARAIAKSLSNIRKIRSLASYYRTDIGLSLWPPGKI